LEAEVLTEEEVEDAKVQEAKVVVLDMVEGTRTGKAMVTQVVEEVKGLLYL